MQFKKPKNQSPWKPTIINPARKPNPIFIHFRIWRPAGRNFPLHHILYDLTNREPTVTKWKNRNENTKRSIIIGTENRHPNPVSAKNSINAFTQSRFTQSIRRIPSD